MLRVGIDVRLERWYSDRVGAAVLLKYNRGRNKNINADIGCG